MFTSYIPGAATSCVIAALGAVTNTLSLSYFARRENEQLGSRLLILLNILDVVVCLFGAVASPVFYRVNYKFTVDGLKLFYLLSGLMQVLNEGTGFVTCLLSVTRAISLCLPFYHKNGKLIAAAVAGFFAYLTIKATTYVILLYKQAGYSKTFSDIRRAFPYITVISLTIIFVIVVISNVLAVQKLLKNNTEIGGESLNPAVKSATITVLTLSVLFCCFNIIYITVLFSNIADWEIDMRFAEFALWMSIPLNSALNPVVYFYRKKKMREYMLELFSRMRYRPASRVMTTSTNITHLTVVDASKGTGSEPEDVQLTASVINGN
jgi:hypothetical protein